MLELERNVMVYKDLNTSPRILLGPGPSMVHPRVLRAMAHPLVGHLDPQFVYLMNEVQDLLRYVFQTKNEITFPLSGTGSAGMDAVVGNFVEPGDPVLVCVNGYFGERLCDMTKRYGGELTRIDKKWGEAFSPDEIRKALLKKNVKVVMIVMAETSTGVLQPLDKIAEIVHEFGALLLVDCVTSLGGVPVSVDSNGIDIAYSGTQKCISCPPGLSPITINDRARQVIHNRKTKNPSWYLDISLIECYWGNERTYHHTAPISMNYALRESLRLIQEEGLDLRFIRHKENAEFFWHCLSEIGLEPFVEEKYRLPSLTTVKVPVGVNGDEVTKKLLNEYNIEIAGGLGELKGKVWRVGLMGYSSSKENIVLLTGALSRILQNT
ncbi:MAG: alanine--glyoxylate aminotransferase [Chloroflexi bacterium HGW-Chloroflexi-2]|nr:MAG: alanine--glyoxylate aminotransferase [Chloroflexi bacterium HGW-Chloroflexi-2]